MVKPYPTHIRRRGFVLLDTLAALALLAGGVLMATVFFRTEVRELRFTHERFAAMLIAQSEIERLHTISYEQILSGAGRPLDLNLPSAKRVKEINGTLTVVKRSPGLKAATVRIDWRSPSGTPHHVKLTNVFSREGSRR